MNYERNNILGLNITRINFEQALAEVRLLGLNHIPSYVCFANVHMTIEGHKNASFASQVNAATMVLADGVPIAIANRLLYRKKQERIAGMDFLPRLLQEGKGYRLRVFFYGATQEVLDAIQQKISTNNYPVDLVGMLSPPFRPLSVAEQDGYIQQINQAHPHVVFVGLGCPKQERWMHQHSPDIHAVLLGVGGAFQTFAGTQKRAPKWMQRSGLEWLYRLSQEPGRLFKRYFVTNSLFLYLLAKALIKKIIIGRK